MAISKRLRFEILRRDNHTCYYCGRKPPEVELTIDHVLPQALGGTDEATNLVAACQDCNSGKTSVAPGAPLVAQVDEDAIRWSAAMQAAIVKAESDHEAVIAYREQFLEAWNDYKRPAELDENWRVSVDNFRARGLPIEMLVDAAHRAMAKQNIGLGTKFRYMCGIAWSKVSEIEKQARSILMVEVVQGDGEEGRPTLKDELLPIIGQQAFESALEEVRGWYADYEEEDERTEEQIEQDAIVSALNDMSYSRHALSRAIEDLLHVLVPSAEVADAWEKAAAPGTPGHDQWRTAAELIVSGRAKAHMESLGAEERDEWLLYAAELNAGNPWGWGGEIPEDRALQRAGRLALEVAAGWRFNAMCFGVGRHISRCPQRGTARVALAGCGDCGIDPLAAEIGLLVCDTHLERVIEKGIGDSGGHTLAVTDFIVLTPNPEDEVPF